MRAATAICWCASNTCPVFRQQAWPKTTQRGIDAMPRGTGFEFDNRRVSGIKTDKGDIQCEIVVTAPAGESAVFVERSDDGSIVLQHPQLGRLTIAADQYGEVTSGTPSGSVAELVLGQNAFSAAVSLNHADRESTLAAARECN